MIKRLLVMSILVVTGSCANCRRDTGGNGNVTASSSGSGATSSSAQSGSSGASNGSSAASGGSSAASASASGQTSGTSGSGTSGLSSGNASSGAVTSSMSTSSSSTGGSASSMVNMPPDTQITAGPMGAIGQPDVVFAFTGADDSAVALFECRLDGAAFQTCASPHAYASLAEAAHLFEVRAVDDTGLQDPSPAAQAFAVDLTAPQVMLNGPPDPSTMANGVLTFSATEPVSFRCTLDGIPVMPCVSPVPYSLADGPHNFSVLAADAAGNESAPANHTWTVDTTPPDTFIDAGPPALAANATTLVFSCDEAPCTFRCRLDGVTSPCTSPHTIGTQSANHQIAVWATDAAGLADTTPATWAWTSNPSYIAVVPDSQTRTCTNGADFSTCPTSLQPFYGQDGNHDVNPPSYNVQGSRLVDRVTSLEWQRSFTRLGYQEAQAYCEGLDLDGLSDWRVPSRLELNTLLDTGRVLPPLPSLLGLSHPQNHFIWSADLSSSNPNRAWSVSTNYGALDLVAVDYPEALVHCVRGTPLPENNLVLSPAGTMVLDTATGLTWAAQPETTAVWRSALLACESSTLEGFDTWRLPSLKELNTLVDISRNRPALSPVFPAAAGLFWSATPNAAQADSVHTVNMDLGTADLGLPITTRAGVRCVR